MIMGSRKTRRAEEQHVWKIASALGLVSFFAVAVVLLTDAPKYGPKYGPKYSPGTCAVVGPEIVKILGVGKDHYLIKIVEHIGLGVGLTDIKSFENKARHIECPVGE